MAQTRRNLLAVLIDADNIPAKHAAAILKEITRYGEPALRRVYGDWSGTKLSAWREQVRELGMQAKQETANTTGKNASDIGLVIDAMDILHTGRFDGFVLVSSDSDFTALASRLREDGVEVIGIGESKAPVSLRNICTRFILIENLTEQELEPEQEQKGEPAAAQPATKNPTKEVQVATSPKKEPASKVVPLVLNAMKDLDPDAEWYGLGPVGSQINRATPDFDHRTFGSNKLSDLLRKTGRFELRSKDGHLQVRRKG